jgi:Domain of unknown function (DUF6249)
MSDFDADLLIPLAAIVLGLAIPLLGIVTNYRRKKAILDAHHRERMAAIERGIELPPLPPGLVDDERHHRPADPGRYLLVGLVALFVGGAIFAFLWNIANHEVAFVGLIPAAVGLAYLLFYWLRARKPQAPGVSET